LLPSFHTKIRITTQSQETLAKFVLTLKYQKIWTGKIDSEAKLPKKLCH
jgi:hypothetical protein